MLELRPMAASVQEDHSRVVDHRHRSEADLPVDSSVIPAVDDECRHTRSWQGCRCGHEGIVAHSSFHTLQPVVQVFGVRKRRFGALLS
jgi:hypothetical protein